MCNEPRVNQPNDVFTSIRCEMRPHTANQVHEVMMTMMRMPVMMLRLSRKRIRINYAMIQRYGRKMTSGPSFGAHTAQPDDYDGIKGCGFRALERGQTEHRKWCGVCVCVCAGGPVVRFDSTTFKRCSTHW